MKTKPKLRARRMWANYHSHCPVPEIFDSKSRAMSRKKSYPATVTVPVAVIPLRNVPAIIYEAMVAFQSEHSGGFEPGMRAALTAIGVLPRTRKGGSK